MPRRFWILTAIVFAGALAIGVFMRTRESLDLASANTKRTWQPVVLMPWVKYGYDFGGTTGASSDPRIDEWFGRLEQDGVKAVAWFLFADGRGSLVFNAAGVVTGLAPGFRVDYRAVLSMAKKHGLQLIWIVTDFELGMPAQTDGSVHMFGHADLLEDEAKRASFIQNALSPVLQDDASQIAGWIVMNEPEHLLRSGRVSESAIRAFAQEAAGAIKRYHPGQRVGLANSDLASMIEFSDINALDFLVFHHYSPSLPPPVDFVRTKLAHSKPVFIGEFNLNYPPGLDLDRFIRTSRALGYAGVWPWSLRDRVDESGTKATETEPQFAEISAYAQSMRAPQAPLDESHPRENLLPEVERRIASLTGKPDFHRSEAQLNANWAASLAHASTTEDPQKQQADLLTATERTRMHSYLQRETTLELEWLQALHQRLQ